MPFQPVDEVVSCALRGQMDSQSIAMVLNVGKPGGIDPVELPTVANIVAGFWTDLRGNLSSAVSINEVYVTDLQAENGPTFTLPIIPPQRQGALAPESLPNNVALCVTHRTSNRGRSFRGRTYVPGILETEVSVNTITSVRANSIALAFNNLRTVLETNGYGFAVVSRRANGLPRPVGIWTSVIVSVVRDLTVDSQRRRLPGRGR